MQIEMNKLYSEDVEQSILGCLLVFKESIKNIKLIDEEDFFNEKNKKIFNLIKELADNNKPIEILSVKELAKSKEMNEKNIFSYLIELTDKVVTSANLDYYINQLKNYSTRRAVVQKSVENINNMYQIGADVESEEIKKNTIKSISDIKTATVIKDEMEMVQLISETMEDIDKKYNKRDDLKYHTGFFELDKVTDGLHEQELTLIAARPGCGKTALALNIAENISKKGVCTYFVSLEMSEKQLGNRLVSSSTGIDSHRLRSGWLEDEDFKKINIAIADLQELKMIIDSKSTTIQEIELKASELKARKNIGLIIIDYLQLLKSKTKFNCREQEVADISRKLKLLSKDLNIPIIALCQLNRESLKRTRPINADLRESGSLEQDADNIIFIYADEEEQQKRIVNTELIVSKQRNGPTGTVRIKFDKKTMTYLNVV